MSVSIGPDGKYYYTTSSKNSYQWYTNSSTSEWIFYDQPKSLDELLELDYSKLDKDLLAEELRSKKKKDIHLLEDDLFEI